MPPELAATPAPAALRIADVTLFYGERTGGIRTYLEAKVAFAARTGTFEHHLVIPGRPDLGPPDRSRPPWRHEQRSLRLAASNGYRIPLGGGGLIATLRELAPDVVFLHDPYWTPRLASRAAHECGAAVIAVHHASAALQAGSLPGPQRVYQHALRRWYRRAYLEVDAVMSVVDPAPDARRVATLPLRLGLDPAFRPRPQVRRSDHVLYAGRLSREKGLRELLDAAAASPDPWPLDLVGTGPAEDMLRHRAETLGIAHRVHFHPYLTDRDALARRFAAAACVVLPGPHETFGLVALEAAACAAPVVTAGQTPSAALIDGPCETFRAGDARDLGRAIASIRRTPVDHLAASRLAARHSWDAALSAELADLHELLGR